MGESSMPPVEHETTGKQTETVFGRISTIVSTTTSVAALLTALSSDSASTTWLLWVATGLCAACLAIVFASTKPAWGSKSAKSFTIATACSATVLACAWLFAFRDEIRFSRALTNFSDGPSVLVDEGVSRCVLMSKATGGPPRRLASFVNALIEEPHRTRICSPARCQDKDVALVVAGVETANALSLNISVPAPGQARPTPDPKNLADLLSEIESSTLLLANAFDNAGPAQIRLVAPPEGLSEVLKAAYHLGAAVRLSRSNDPKADAHLQSFLALARMLPPQPEAHDNWILNGIVFAVSHFKRTNDLKRGLEAAQIGEQLFPNEPRVVVAESYMRLVANGDTTCQGILPDSWSGDGPLESALRGICAQRAGDYWAAALMLEKASQGSPRSADPRSMFVLHGAVALLTSMTTGNAPQRGERIVSHAEQANGFYPDVRLIRILSGFGYALKRNAPTSEQIFDTLRQEAPTERDALASEYWRARGLAETDRTDDAIAVLRPMVSNRSVNAEVLGLLSELVVAPGAPASTIEDGMKYAKRALQLDVNDVKANRVLALYQASQTNGLLKSARESLEENTLVLFQKVIQGGGGDSEIYAKMSDIYRDLAKATEARESRRKSIELQCSHGGDAVACRALEVTDSLHAQQDGKALIAYNEMTRWLMDHERDGSEEQRDAMLVEVATAWYGRGRLDFAEQIYNDISDNVRESPQLPAYVNIMATVNCNLGFIYVDRSQSQRAIQAFRSALRVQRIPDCEAGLAIALKQAHQDDAALREYRVAKSDDASYEGNIDMLKTNNFWSETACQELKALSAQDKREASATQ